MASGAECAPLGNEVRKRIVDTCESSPKPKLLDPWRVSLTTFLLTCCRDYSTWAAVLEALAFYLGGSATGKGRLKSIKLTTYEIRLLRSIVFISPCAFVTFKGCFRCLAFIGNEMMKIPEYRLFVTGQKVAKGITHEGISSRLSLLPIRSTASFMNQNDQGIGCKLTKLCYPLLMVSQKDTFCVCYLGPTRRLRSKRAFHHRGFHLRKVAKDFEDSPSANFPRLLLKVYSSEISSDRFAGFISRAVDQARKISRGAKFRKHHSALQRTRLRNIAKSSAEKMEIDSLLQENPPRVFIGVRVRERSRYLRRLRERQMEREVSSAASELECDVSVPLDRRLDGSDVRNSKCDVTCTVCSHSPRLDRERVPYSRRTQAYATVRTRDSGEDVSEPCPRVAPRPGGESGQAPRGSRSPSRPVTKHGGKTPLRRPWTVSGVSVVSRAWAWVLIMLTLWACVETAHEDSPMRNGCEAYAGTEGEVCGSRYIRNNPKGLYDLCKCRKIRGCLRISLMKVDGNATFLLNSFSFPLLREITEYLFLYRVPGLTTLKHMFPNLAVIRGESLFYNYALVIYSLPALEEVGLLSLTTILRGSVRIEKNPALCYVHTVDWDRITVYPLGENVFKRNRAKECAPCPADLECRGWNVCDGARCWGPRDCQQICEQECTSGCVGGECCHQECVGGCSSPRNASSCVSCRHVLLRGRCLESCPPDMYKMYDTTCVTRSECRWRKGFLAEETRECRGCPPPQREHRGLCVPGRDLSRRRVDVVSSIGQAEDLRRYTSVHALVISITGGENVERELQRCLANIEEVEDYVKIFKTNITSTEILPNLRTIHGKNLVYNNYSLVVLDNPHLRTLAPWTNPDQRFSIGRGKVFFQTNPRLCLDQIYSLVTSANLSSVSETDVSTFSNGQRASCEVYELPAQVTASPHYGTFLITVGPVPSPLLASVNAFYISYRKATHNVTQYEETCSNQGWSVEEFTPKTSANGVFELQLSGLESATRYAVYVKAFSLTPGGTVVQSAIKYAFTSPFNPSQPVGLGWASPKSSELELWWSKPLYPNGAVDHYLVTLVMVPRASTISRDFCSPSVDVTLKSIAQRAEEKQDSYIKMRKQRWEEELASSKAPEANTCSVPPRCCSCGGGEEEEKAEVEEKKKKSTQDFELYLMDDDMNKEVIYTRSQRKLQSKADAQEPPFEDAHLGSFVSGKDAQWNSDVFQASLTGGNSGPLLLPVGLRRTSNNFTKIVDGTNKRRETLRDLSAHYQLHSNATHRVQDTNNSYFRVVHQLTRDLHLSVRNLRHHTLYAVGVVACHAPTNCTYTVGGEAPESPAAKKHLCKLCSSVPAQAAATTALNNTSDIIPDDSLQASVDNTSASVALSWGPPKASNGEVLSYLYYCALHQSPKSTHCVTRTQYEEAGRQVFLRDLVPGEYSCWVRARSEVGDGPESAPITFHIPDTRTPEDKSTVWWTVGVAIVVISALIGLSLRRHRSRHKIPDTIEEVENNPFYREGFAPSEMFRENYILWRDDLRVLFELPLGHGYFGMVFAGELKDGGGAKRVAVKTHSESASTEEIKQFLKEAAMMQDIKCHHVVEFIGVVGDYAPVYVVMELMQEGDLKSLLKKQKGAAITDQKVLEMAVEAADGMAYLASRRLVHRDLAARNCMLDHNLTLKIGDFGLTRNLKSDYYRREGQGLLPVKWMAPESLKFSRYSTQSDVWSYGVLLWEMATRGVTPYKNNTNDDVIRLVVENRATLPRPRNCPDPIYKVMRRCWKFNPCDRPTFPSIAKYLLKHTREQFQDSFEQVSFIHNAAREASRHCSGSEVRPGYMAEASQEEDSFYHDLNNTSDLSDEGSLEKEAGREQGRPDARPPAARSHALRCPRRTLHIASRLQSFSQHRFPSASPPSPQSSAAAPLLAVGESAVVGSAVGESAVGLRVPPVEASVPTPCNGSSASHRPLPQRDVHVYTNFITRELPHVPRHQAAPPWPARCGFSPRAQGRCMCPADRLFPRAGLTTGPVRSGTDGGPPCLSCATIGPAVTFCKKIVTRCTSPSSGALLASPGALEAPPMGYMSEPQTPAQQLLTAPPPAAASAPSSPCGSSSRGAEPFSLPGRKPRPLSRVRLTSSQPRALTRAVARTDRNAQSIFEISALCQKEMLPLAVSAPFLSAGAAPWAEEHELPSDTSATSTPLRVLASEPSAATHATHPSAHFNRTGSLKEPPVYTTHDQASLPLHSSPPAPSLSSGTAAPSSTPPAVATASPSIAEPSATAVLPPTSSSASTAPASADSLAPLFVPSPKMLAVFSATSDLGNRHSSRSPAAARRQRDLELM